MSPLGHLVRGAGIVAALGLAACGGGGAPAGTAAEIEPTTPSTAPATSGPRSGEEPQPATLEVLETRPHDPDAFIQGLVFDGAGRLYESTGLYGESTLREVDPTSGEVMRRVDLDASFFAEGLASVDDQLIQLTWREGVAMVWDAATFEPAGRFSYEGEGWGLCYDGARLVMSDGSSLLTFRDPETFEREGAIEVTAGGAPVTRLNELECAGGLVYANVWQTDEIVVIDPGTGEVTTRVDASGLLSPDQREGADVLNGIAFDPASDTFLVTGKLWPALFVVHIQPS